MPLKRNNKSLTFSERKVRDKHVRPFWRQTKNRQPRFNILRLSVLIFIFLILGAVTLAMWQNKYLAIKQTMVNRENPRQSNDYLILDSEVQELIQKIMKKRFLWFLRRNTLMTIGQRFLQKELSTDGRFQSMRIKKTWPDKLTINFSQAQPVARITVLGDKDYYLNSNGQIISPVFIILRHLDQPSIIDKTTLTWQNQALAEAIQAALGLVQGQNELNNLIKVKLVEIGQETGILELKAVTDEGWLARFMVGPELNQEIGNLKLILESQLPADKRKELEYVDLRFGNKIYYK